MATKRKTKKQTVDEPVIKYVDPETNLKAEPEVAEREGNRKDPMFVVTAETLKGFEHYYDGDAFDNLFQCMKRRRDKEK